MSHNVTGSWWTIKTKQYVGSTLPNISVDICGDIRWRKRLIVIPCSAFLKKKK